MSVGSLNTNLQKSFDHAFLALQALLRC
jgi:hypothetical protein